MKKYDISFFSYVRRREALGLEVFVWILGAKKWLILDAICGSEQTALHDIIVFNVHVLAVNLWSV